MFVQRCCVFVFGILTPVKLTYFEVVDDNDNLTGKTASFTEVHKKGLWHRGVHIIIYTPDGEIVMQKRSPSMKLHPDEIEISVGGGVDIGETPLDAVIREVNEELSLELTKHKVKFLGKRKFNHRTKSQIVRVILYSYSACVPKDKINLDIKTDETTKVFLISKRKLNSSLRVHRIKNLGKISSSYAYWKYLIASI